MYKAKNKSGTIQATEHQKEAAENKFPHILWQQVDFHPNVAQISTEIPVNRQKKLNARLHPIAVM